MSSGERGDLLKTFRQLKNPQPQIGDKNWLRHGINTSAARIDELLLTGATKAEMISDLVARKLAPNDQKAGSRIGPHLNSLESGLGGNNQMAHGIPLTKNKDGKLMFDIEKIEKMLGNIASSRDQSPENNSLLAQGEIPIWDEIQAIYKENAAPGEDIAPDRLKKLIEKLFQNQRRDLHPNWWEETKKIIRNELEKQTHMDKAIQGRAILHNKE